MKGLTTLERVRGCLAVVWTKENGETHQLSGLFFSHEKKQAEDCLAFWKRQSRQNPAKG
jgi:hypothetical protein